MADGINIEIVSPEHLILSEEASAVTVPGSEGYFTVMGDHAPVMTTLRPGFVIVAAGTGQKTVFVRGGFAEVGGGAVSILAEDARNVADFDRAEIESAIVEAEQAAAAAASLEDKDAAQMVLDSLRNLMTEVEHMGPAITM